MLTEQEVEQLALEEMAVARSLGCTCYPSVTIEVFNDGLAVGVDMMHSDECEMPDG